MVTDSMNDCKSSQHKHKLTKNRNHHGCITNRIKLNHSLAKMLLIQCKWDANEVLNKYFACDNEYFECKGVKPFHKSWEDSIAKAWQYECSCSPTAIQSEQNQQASSLSLLMICCDVCLDRDFKDHFLSLICGHSFCHDCWFNYCRVNVQNGQSTGIRCMNSDCQLFLPEDFVHFIFKKTILLREKYDLLSFRESVDSYIRMRLCINSECQTVIAAQEQPASKRVTCTNCNNSFCFQCGNDYHAPTDCKTILLWYRKCADDSETAHYISAHTKLCPNCSSCIEKNGGCNHMSCYSCKHEFCWICLGTWDIHGPQYFKCSKYKENLDIKNESERAREALKKYLFYYERWDNHMKSLKLEDENRQRIQAKIDDELNRNNGTWIDWQYLLRGAKILSKCRYTLQYTYPYAYYMECGPQKELFEFQQAALENEIENLAWKIENAETTDRGALENQMTIVEKRRTTLLYNFFQY
ncbi:protein ariadne-2-like [Dermatophagoides farinae]|uniref:RBR-type E3 ubiquitin transferase n=1 Tax=Dermatophagoides farinae TaxID=6954 RepID=A0A9D4P9F8_DERFA|nr:protein ariadne-2-like [Dermatophagoides farinae]